MGEETEACNRPSRMLTQLSREVTQIHTNTQMHTIQYNTKHKHTHTEGDTNTCNYTNTQTKQIDNRPYSMLPQLLGEVVTTERSHKQWGAISGHRVGNGGNTQQGGKRA